MIEILESISQDLFAGDTKLHKMSSSLVYFYFQMAVDTLLINLSNTEKSYKSTLTQMFLLLYKK